LPSVRLTTSHDLSVLLKKYLSDDFCSNTVTPPVDSTLPPQPVHVSSRDRIDSRGCRTFRQALRSTGKLVSFAREKMKLVQKKSELKLLDVCRRDGKTQKNLKKFTHSSAVQLDRAFQYPWELAWYLSLSFCLRTSTEHLLASGSLQNLSEMSD